MASDVIERWKASA